MIRDGVGAPSGPQPVLHGQPAGFGQVAIKHAPGAHRLDQAGLVLGRHLGIERPCVERLAQQFRDMALEVDRQLLVALRLAAEGIGAVDQAVVVHLDEGFQLHPELLAVMQQGAMVVRDAPGAGVEIVARSKAHGLDRTADFLDPVAATNGIGAASCAALELQHLHLVAGLGQFIGGQQTRQPATQHQHGLAGPPAGQLRRSGKAAFGRVAKCCHGLVHGKASPGLADHREQFATRRHGHFTHDEYLSGALSRADSLFLAKRFQGALAAIASISTYILGRPRAAIWMVERVGVLGCSGVPK